MLDRHSILNLWGRVAGLRRRPFSRNVAAVMSGTIVAQGINIAFAPVLSRIFNPEAFGALGVFNSLLAILSPLAAMSYPIAIVLVDNEKHAVTLVRLCVSIALAVSVAILAVIAIFNEYLVTISSIEIINSFLFLLPIAVFSSGMMQIAQHWVLRKHEFLAAARVSVVHSLAMNCLKAGFGLFQPVAAVLIVAAAAAPALFTAMLSFALQRNARSDKHRATDARQGVNLTTVRMLGFTHRAFPLFRTPQSMINAFGVVIPVLLLAQFDGATAAGHYSLAMQVLLLPSLLIGKAIGDVFYPKFAEIFRTGDNHVRALRFATFGMAAVGFIPFSILIFFGPPLFEIVFGSDWRRSGEFSQWLSLWLFFAFCNRPAVTAIPVLRIEHAMLIWEIVSSTTRVAALMVGFLYFSSTYLAIVLFAIAGAGLNFALIIYVNRMAATHPGPIN